MKRLLMTWEHELFRTSFNQFLDREVVPRWTEFEAAGIVDRSVWRAAGDNGFLAPEVPEEYGGVGSNDFRYNAVINEQINARRLRGFGIMLHNDIVTPYLLRLGTEDQKQRWLPGMVTGERISAIAMTEPGAGSDLASIQTRAKKLSDGYLINGQKVFITNGQNADLVVVAARTAESRYRGLSLLVVERDMDGFKRGRNLKKIGMYAQDTSELFFDNVHVPAENLLGGEDEAFIHLVENLPRERLSIAIGAVAAAEYAIEITTEYVKNRHAYGKMIGDLQNTRFLLADLATTTQLVRTFVDECIVRHNAGELTADDAAMAKLACTENQVHVIDRCLQLHGGTGYMADVTVAQMWLDARAQTIYGGTSEVMKHIIGKGLVAPDLGRQL